MRDFTSGRKLNREFTGAGYNTLSPSRVHVYACCFIRLSILHVRSSLATRQRIMNISMTNLRTGPAHVAACCGGLIGVCCAAHYQCCGVIHRYLDNSIVSLMPPLLIITFKKHV
jgi:hypothetical protein